MVRGSEQIEQYKQTNVASDRVARLKRGCLGLETRPFLIGMEGGRTGRDGEELVAKALDGQLYPCPAYVGCA